MWQKSKRNIYSEYSHEQIYKEILTTIQNKIETSLFLARFMDIIHSLSPFQQMWLIIMYHRSHSQSFSMCSDSAGVILLKEVNNFSPISQIGIKATSSSYFLRSDSKSMPY